MRFLHDFSSPYMIKLQGETPYPITEPADSVHKDLSRRWHHGKTAFAVRLRNPEQGPSRLLHVSLLLQKLNLSQLESERQRRNLSLTKRTFKGSH
jgi:hypothetical protein